MARVEKLFHWQDLTLVLYYKVSFVLFDIFDRAQRLDKSSIEFYRVRRSTVRKEGEGRERSKLIFLAWRKLASEMSFPVLIWTRGSSTLDNCRQLFALIYRARTAADRAWMPTAFASWWKTIDTRASMYLSPCGE